MRHRNKAHINKTSSYWKKQAFSITGANEIIHAEFERV